MAWRRDGSACRVSLRSSQAAVSQGSRRATTRRVHIALAGPCTRVASSLLRANRLRAQPLLAQTHAMRDAGAVRQALAEAGFFYCPDARVEDRAVPPPPPPPPPSRTKWTRRVPHPVLIGHAASLLLGEEEGPPTLAWRTALFPAPPHPTPPCLAPPRLAPPRLGAPQPVDRCGFLCLARAVVRARRRAGGPQVCFACGKAIHGWLPHDVPLYEHCKVRAL